MKAVDELLEIMRTLRDPIHGCPWDREQTFSSILSYSLEEIYELAGAIEQNDMQEIRDELGDVLFHLVFYAQMAQEAGEFDFRGVVENIVAKLQRRHPHVFGTERVRDAGEQRLAWERIKSEERERQNGAKDTPLSLLDGISKALPAVIRAGKLQQRAATVGFDWDDTRQVLDKLDEELAELHYEIENGMDKQRITDELGDLMFACVNLARHVQVDPELALRQTNRKFEQRFNYIERRLAEQQRKPQDASLEEMEGLWQEAKQQQGHD